MKSGRAPVTERLRCTRVAAAMPSMAVASFLAAFMQAGVRVAGGELPATRIAFIRRLVTFLALLPVLLRGYRRK